MTGYIFVAGGVISGVGKGVITASLGKILQEHGYRVTLIKIDPYINCDAGTLRPTEHGEVWVTHDGGEIDQDLGTYERFIGQNLSRRHNITTGQVYSRVIEKERSGAYLGQTVQFIPHIVAEIRERIEAVAGDFEFVIIELGGTVGDYENVPYLHAIKSIESAIGSSGVAYVFVTYVPLPAHLQEMKTKPTQQAVRLLGQEGIFPQFVVCRSSTALGEASKKKIATAINLAPDRIITAPDLASVYEMPLCLEEQSMGMRLLAHFGLCSRRAPEWASWALRLKALRHGPRRVTIAVVGKYLRGGQSPMIDSHLSVYHALLHAGAELDARIDIRWIDSQECEQVPLLDQLLAGCDGIIVPGGFGSTGVEGKINVISYARKVGVPYLGLCYGMQLAVVEFARNVCGIGDAHTTEIAQETSAPVIDLLPDQRQVLGEQKFGASMRLGDFQAELIKGTHVARCYGHQSSVIERHRHRYEVNPTYVPLLERGGLVFSGQHRRQDGTVLMEFCEIPTHPFFVGAQAHPEFKSRFGTPSPLFYGFVRAALQNN